MKRLIQKTLAAGLSLLLAALPAAGQQKAQSESFRLLNGGMRTLMSDHFRADAAVFEYIQRLRGLQADSTMPSPNSFAHAVAARIILESVAHDPKEIEARYSKIPELDPSVVSRLADLAAKLQEQAKTDRKLARELWKDRASWVVSGGRNDSPPLFLVRALHGYLSTIQSRRDEWLWNLDPPPVVAGLISSLPNPTVLRPPRTAPAGASDPVQAQVPAPAELRTPALDPKGFKTPAGLRAKLRIFRSGEWLVMYSAFALAVGNPLWMLMFGISPGMSGLIYGGQLLLTPPMLKLLSKLHAVLIPYPEWAWMKHAPRSAYSVETRELKESVDRVALRLGLPPGETPPSNILPRSHLAMLAVLGNRRPSIFASPQLIDYSQDQIDGVIAHEFGHHVFKDIKSRDLSAYASRVLWAVQSAWALVLLLLSFLGPVPLKLSAVLLASGLALHASARALNILADRQQELRADLFSSWLTYPELPLVEWMETMERQKSKLLREHPLQGSPMARLKYLLQSLTHPHLLYRAAYMRRQAGSWQRPNPAP